MATKNNLNDLHFAEMYVDFLSRRVSNPETRARAKILLATIQMLDLRHPTWRVELIAELDRLGIDKEVEKLFPLPDVDDGALFREFMNNILGK